MQVRAPSREVGGLRRRRGTIRVTACGAGNFEHQHPLLLQGCPPARPSVSWQGSAGTGARGPESRKGCGHVSPWIPQAAACPTAACRRPGQCSESLAAGTCMLSPSRFCGSGRGAQPWKTTCGPQNHDANQRSPRQRDNGPAHAPGSAYPILFWPIASAGDFKRPRRPALPAAESSTRAGWSPTVTVAAQPIRLAGSRSSLSQRFPARSMNLKPAAPRRQARPRRTTG